VCVCAAAVKVRAPCCPLDEMRGFNMYICVYEG
jgi:hypothetical protein